MISLDGTDCPILEPWPYDAGYFSQKLNGPGLKYEVGVAINSNNIVWINGPFKAGESDLNIYRECLREYLCDDEGVECDQFYQGDPRLKNPKVHQGARYRRQKKEVRARQENLNARLKRFKVLDDSFRHDLSKHGECFRAVAVLTQIGLNHGRWSLKRIRYNLEYN